MPTLSDVFNVNSSAADTSTLTTGSFTPQVGDVIVVKGILENTLSSSAYGTPSDSNTNSYTLLASDSSSSRCWVGLWVSTVAIAGAMTVSITPSGVNLWHSVTVEHWTRAALAPTPALSSPVTGSSSPSATITTTGTSSAVSWLNGDWSANSPASRVYDSTSASPVEDGLHDKSTGNYVGYYAYQNAASAGSQTIGLTAPTGQTWSMLGVEVLDTGSAGSPDPNQARALQTWQ